MQDLVHVGGLLIVGRCGLINHWRGHPLASDFAEDVYWSDFPDLYKLALYLSKIILVFVQVFDLYFFKTIAWDWMMMTRYIIKSNRYEVNSIPSSHQGGIHDL